jgi:hypothetical protein
MSNPKTAIQEIKKLMVQFGLLSPENFAEAKLVDGTVVKVEGDLVEGAAIKVVTEDAEIPAPDGVHELMDGTKVETKDGIVVKVEKVEESPVVEEAMEEEVIETEVPAEVSSVAEPVVAAIVEAILPVLEEVKDLAEEMKKMKVMMESYKNDFESFKKEPAGKKINGGKTDFSNVEKINSDDARIATIMSFRKLKK